MVPQGGVSAVQSPRSRADDDVSAMQRHRSGEDCALSARHEAVHEASVSVVFWVRVREEGEGVRVSQVPRVGWGGE